MMKSTSQDTFVWPQPRRDNAAVPSLKDKARDMDFEEAYAKHMSDRLGEEKARESGDFYRSSPLSGPSPPDTCRVRISKLGLQCLRLDEKSPSIMIFIAESRAYHGTSVCKHFMARATRP
jgi:hypothetical protein